VGVELAKQKSVARVNKGWIREVEKCRKMWGFNWQSKNLCTYRGVSASHYSGNVHTPTLVYYLSMYAKLVGSDYAKQSLLVY